MVLAVLRAEFFFPENGSLKEKRQFIRSIKDRARSSFNVSVGEVDHQDLWQRAGLAFVSVAADKSIAEDTIVKVKKMLEKNYPEFLLHVKVEFINL